MDVLKVLDALADDYGWALVTDIADSIGESRTSVAMTLVHARRDGLVESRNDSGVQWWGLTEDGDVARLSDGERPMRVSSLLTPKLYHEIEAAPMTNPSEQALPFSKAAIEAAARVMRNQHPHYVLSDGFAADILIAAVNADPRVKAFLKLAALTDEELVERVARALFAVSEHGAFADDVANARVALAAMGLPVDEQDGP